MQKYKIYSLTCKDTPNIVYIGITKKSLLARLFRHFSASEEREDENPIKVEWTKKYWRNMQINLIEEAEEKVATKKESEIIFDYIKKGYQVLNITYRKVSVFDINGNLVKNYSSFMHLAKDLGIKYNGIYKFIDKNKLYKGLQYRTYNGATKIEPFIIRKKGIKILQLNLDGSLIKEWNSTAEAAQTLFNKKKSSNITTCLKGLTSQAYGYKWQYKNL